MENGMQGTVLVVDDNPDEIRIMKLILEKMAPELKMRTAAHGKAALAILREEKELPALIFLDMKMFGMSGTDTLRLIRADARLHDIPVVILTNSSMESEKKEAYEAGVNSFMQKAFDLDQFAQDIGMLLARWLK